MPISKVGQRRQIVIPKEISDELGLHEGDFVEVTRDKSVVIITPKKLVDADEGLTSAQRATILTRAWLKAWKMSRADGSIGRSTRSMPCSPVSMERSLSVQPDRNAASVFRAISEKLCERSPERPTIV